MEINRTARTALAGALGAGLAALAIAIPSLGSGSDTVRAAATVKYLWSTINICDTQHHPDQVGIRARMPGDAKPDRLRMRFFVQYMRDGSWVPVKNGGMSNWLRVGSGLYKYQEFGWTFKFPNVQPGDHFTMRGLVKFQWRRHGTIIRAAHAYTSSHHPTKFGDPARYSKATCGVSGSV
jgi:hypothetical protein